MHASAGRYPKNSAQGHIFRHNSISLMWFSDSVVRRTTDKGDSKMKTVGAFAQFSTEGRTQWRIFQPSVKRSPQRQSRCLNVEDLRIRGGHRRSFDDIDVGSATGL